MTLSMKLGQIGLGLAALFLLGACASTQDETVADATSDESVSDSIIDETAIPPTRPLPNLPNLGEAPEITNETWINTDEPITLASQRGNVVLLEFWTFG